MRTVLAILIPLVCVYADNAQYVNVKSVKGGHQGGYYRQYNPAAKLPNFYANSTRGYESQNVTQGGYHRDYEIGVCYIEVPTASLVFNQAQVPAGNGSRPELSRIRSCCKGYIRNIHNFKICDPVCTEECVNALCTAPETCTCFPDHVKNLGGFCIPTCPIGCQNGHCSGGECLCKDGFVIDSESKYCLPKCMENCGGIGNCTTPNTCSCPSGYTSTNTGNCKPACDKCENGDCVAPNKCTCKQGYIIREAGVCIPDCPQNCRPNGKCVAPGKCEFPETTTAIISASFQPTHKQNAPLYPGSQVYPGIQQTDHQYPGRQPDQYGYPSHERRPGQPGHPNQAGTQNQPGTGQTGYPNRPEGPNQPGNPNYPGYPNKPGQSSYPYTTAQGNPKPPGQPDQYSPNPNLHSPNQPQTGTQKHTYPPSSGLSGTQVHVDSQGQTGEYNHAQNLYPDIQQYNQEFEPYCSQPCINGYCVEGNKCQCNPGYVLNVDNSSGTSYCVPHCAGGCHNGVCSAPNFCICNMGYYKDHSVKGRPQCVKRNKRSVDTPNVAKLLTLNIPDYR